jgi:adenylate cyclase
MNFDESLEVRFTVHPEVRKVEDYVFCIGGPANTPHVRCQARIPAGSSRRLELDLAPGRYRIRSPQAAGTVIAEWVEENVADSGRIEARVAGWSPASVIFGGTEARPSLAGQDVPLQRDGGGHFSAEIVNETGGEMVILLEEEAWTEKAASASLVTSLQDFRELFDAEVLAPGFEIGIRSLTVVFSDLKGSTALYERVGDARAYALVREHFAFMETLIRKHEGGIVKTIGDSVMAVFTSTANAVATCLDIQEMVADFNAREGLPSAITLKLGVHGGPLIAVNSNDRLDYFGSTVNLAARTESQGNGGDIVITGEVYRIAGIAGLIRERGARVEAFRAELKGISQTQDLVRILLH